jgi:WD40 repeat protein
VVTGQQTLAVKGHVQAARSVAFSPDGRHLATADSMSVVRVWNALTGDEIRALYGLQASPLSVAYSPDGTRLASAGLQRTVLVWDLTADPSPRTLTGHAGQVYAVAFSPDGKQLASAGLDKTVRLWDVQTGADFLFRKDYDSVLFHPDGRHFLAGAPPFQWVDVDFQTGQAAPLPPHCQWALGAATISPDGRYLAAANSRSAQETTIWVLQAGRKVLTCEGFEGPVVALAYSPDGARLAGADNLGSVTILDADTGRQRIVVSNAPGPTFYQLVFSPDGTRLAGGAADGVVKVWEAATGRVLLTLVGHTLNPVLGLAFSPDGQRLASAGLDGRVKIWDTDLGVDLLTLNPLAARLNCVKWSPDGQRLAAGAADGTVRVWDAGPHAP